MWTALAAALLWGDAGVSLDWELTITKKFSLLEEKDDM
jgi:hypothetical protein